MFSVALRTICPQNLTVFHTVTLLSTLQVIFSKVKQYKVFDKVVDNIFFLELVFLFIQLKLKWIIWIELN